jgi:flagellin
MPIVVNSNPTASTASLNLSRANDSLRKSLARLSSGKRIVSPADDAGGLAVGYKLGSRLNRVEAVKQNVQNGLSYLQVQDGALSSIGDILNRMSELRTMAQDVTKNTSDIENYSKEFLELQRQLSQVYREKFNGVSVFAKSTASAVLNPPDLRPQLNKNNTSGEITFSRTLYTHDSGQAVDGNVSIGVTNLQSVLEIDNLDSRYISVSTYDAITAINIARAATSTSGVDGILNLGNLDSMNTTADDEFSDHSTLSDNERAQAISEVYTSDGFLKSIMFVSVGQFTGMIQKLADARAENGAEQSRLTKVENLLSLNMTNLEAAHSRIMDADIALESTRFARQNVLVQSSAAMVAQANQLTQVALTVIGG